MASQAVVPDNIASASFRTSSALANVRACWATALHVVGVDFAIIRKCFGFGVRDKIETAYRNLAGAYQRKKVMLKEATRREESGTLQLDTLPS